MGSIPQLPCQSACTCKVSAEPELRAVLPIYVHGSRVNQSVDTNSSTLQKLTLSNIDKGSGVFWCGPAQAVQTPTTTPLSVALWPHLQGCHERAQAACPLARGLRPGTPACRIPFIFCFLVGSYTCWLLLKYYQVRQP